MDKIYIKGLKIFAYHGVNPEEKEDGQNFFIDIVMKADLKKAKMTDDVFDTVSYSSVRKTVQRVFTAGKYNLIEYAANKLCESILDEYPSVREVKVTLKKPEAPMNAEFDYVAVEVLEKRK